MGWSLQGCEKAIRCYRQGKRHRKVVHFDRLKLCPKNICLDDEPTSEQHISSLELVTPTENSLPIGHDMEILDDDDDEADSATTMTPCMYTYGLNITTRVSNALR